MGRRFVIGFIISMSCIACIQTSNAGTNEEQIKQAYQDWAKAFRAHDIDGIMSMYAPDVIAYDFISPLQYVGKNAYRKDYQEFLGQFNGPIEIEFRDLKVTAGNDVGYVHALEHISGTMKNGEKIDFWGRCTSGFQKINGKWLDTHDHCSVPADFETGKAVLDLKP